MNSSIKQLYRKFANFYVTKAFINMKWHKVYYLINTETNKTPNTDNRDSHLHYIYAFSRRFLLYKLD